MSLKYTFSGHESFPCRSLWLKKGYDFVVAGKNFNSPSAVVDLGVGKNMVMSIRYWLKSFGLINSDGANDIAHYLFDPINGKDPFIEDLGTLHLLHFLLVSSEEATLYNWTFTRFQKERKEFDKEQLQSFVKRSMIEVGKVNLYNANTVKKDIGVLIQNYALPKNAHSYEDYSTLMIDLDLLRVSSDGKTYHFNTEGKRPVALEIMLYAIVIRKGHDMTVSYDMLQEVAMIFCMNDMELISMMKRLNSAYPEILNYSEVAGIRQLQFIENITPREILDKYYGRAKI